MAVGAAAPGCRRRARFPARGAAGLEPGRRWPRGSSSDRKAPAPRLRSRARRAAAGSSASPASPLASAAHHQARRRSGTGTSPPKSSSAAIAEVPERTSRPGDSALQTSPGSGQMPAPIANFDGVNNINGVMPPDTEGEVGPTTMCSGSISRSRSTKDGRPRLRPGPGQHPVRGLAALRLGRR